MRWYEALAEIKADARKWRERAFIPPARDPIQQDHDEYVEEMSLGGQRYDPKRSD